MTGDRCFFGKCGMENGKRVGGAANRFNDSTVQRINCALKKRGHLPFERSGRGGCRGKRFSERSEWYKSFSEVKTWQVDAFSLARFSWFVLF